MLYSQTRTLGGPSAPENLQNMGDSPVLPLSGLHISSPVTSACPDGEGAFPSTPLPFSLSHLLFLSDLLSPFLSVCFTVADIQALAGQCWSLYQVGGRQEASTLLGI